MEVAPLGHSDGTRPSRRRDSERAARETDGSTQNVARNGNICDDMREIAWTVDFSQIFPENSLPGFLQNVFMHYFIGTVLNADDFAAFIVKHMVHDKSLDNDRGIQGET